MSPFVATMLDLSRNKKDSLMKECVKRFEDGDKIFTVLRPW